MEKSEQKRCAEPPHIALQLTRLKLFLQAHRLPAYRRFRAYIYK